MNCLCEAIGIALPGNGTIPAVDSRRTQARQACRDGSDGTGAAWNYGTGYHLSGVDP